MQDKFSDKNYVGIQDREKVICEFQRLYFPNTSLKDLTDVFNKAKSEYLEVITKKSIQFPQIWNGGEALASILYTLVKIYEPEIVLETGVANGISTQMILKKLPSKSVLHSFDVNLDSFKSVPVSANWKHHLINVNNPKKSFAFEIAKINRNVDIWVHDSDHSKFWQTFEYKQALKLLKPGGFLISDDINSSSAWAELFHNKETLVISDGHKLVGVYQHN
jgi:predicted O-methyltransferase YrrM